MLILNSTEITGNFNISYNGVALNQIDVVKDGVRTTVWRHGEIVIIVDNQPLPITVTVGSNSVTVPANTSETLVYNDLAIGTVIKASATGNDVTTEFLNTTYTGVSKAYRVTNTLSTTSARLQYYCARATGAHWTAYYRVLDATTDILVRAYADQSLYITSGSAHFVTWVGKNPTFINSYDIDTSSTVGSGTVDSLTAAMTMKTNKDTVNFNMTLTMSRDYARTVTSNSYNLEYYAFTAEEI